MAEKEAKLHRYAFGAATDRGSVREQNEDSYGVFVPDTEEVIERLGILAVVADGMGGHFSGGAASKMAVETLGQAYFEGSGASVHAIESAHDREHKRFAAAGRPEASLVNRLRWAFLEANRQVFERVGEGQRGVAGTTCTAALFLPDAMLIAHAGDSRAYLLRRGALEPLTEDHSVVGEMVRKGILSRSEANRHPHRNIITRAMGLRETLEVDVRESLSLARGDRVLLCSDGLFSMIEEEEIAKIAGKGVPAKACQKLVKSAKEAGGLDNITVVLAEKLR
jgi:serine/threonine protein phosphatase PrpC